jgi:pseudaminic acid biosynthesis-associated methylase
MHKWSGEFGKAYTDRNPKSVEAMNELYDKQFGFSRSQMNHEFLGEMSRSIRILEVGANLGVQLQMLQQMGFGNLYGIELQGYAVEQAKQSTTGINLIQGDAFDVPFKDGFFDLVFTSGVLIHINPDDIAVALDEIHRCSRRYIWGMEYFAEDYANVEYHGDTALLWKTNFAKLYLDRFRDLRMVREERYKYLENNNQDAMFLLEKAA